MKTNNFAAPVLYDQRLTEPRHRVILSEIKPHSMLHVHDQILSKMHYNHWGRALKRTNLVKCTNSLIRKHLLGDSSCRALPQLDLNLKKNPQQLMGTLISEHWLYTSEYLPEPGLRYVMQTTFVNFYYTENEESFAQKYKVLNQNSKRKHQRPLRHVTILNSKWARSHYPKPW
jgi:hypothetical protein